MKRGNNILITGAAGFIGSHLSDVIYNKGEFSKLVLLDNLFLGKPSNLNQIQESRKVIKLLGKEFSCTKFNTMKEIIVENKIDTVIDLATIPLPVSLEDPRWCFEEITSMGSVICELLRQGHYGKLYHISTSEVYGSAEYTPMDELHPWQSRTSYAASKGAVDLMIKSYVATFNCNAVILRPFNNYGPRQNDGNYAGVIPIFIRNYLTKTKSTIFGDGQQTRDFIYVTDTAKIIDKLLDTEISKGEIINIASGNEISVKQIFKSIYKDFSVEPVFQAERIGDVKQHFACTTKLFNYIKKFDFTTFDEGIIRTIDWYDSK